jgi:CDP-diglyceride synthetase
MVPMVWAALTAYLFFLEGELLPEAALSAFLPFAWALGGGLAGYLFGEWLAKRKR